MLHSSFDLELLNYMNRNMFEHVFFNSCVSIAHVHKYAHIRNARERYTANQSDDQTNDTLWNETNL